MLQTEKNCRQCNKIFEKRINCSVKAWTLSKYCSKVCKNAAQIGISFTNTGSFKRGNVPTVPAESRKRGPANNKWKGGPLNKECAICSKSFQVDRDRADAKTCSIECNKLYRKTPEFRMQLSKSQRSRISKEWLEQTENIKKFKNLLRRCSRYNMWRQEIFKRDDFTCCICKIRGGKLQADHIEPFISILLRHKVETYEQAIECAELWDSTNGRTLCAECHYKTPTFGSKVHRVLAANYLYSL